MTLERLLTYKDAQATGLWKEVAPDIVTVPFWQPSFCQCLVDAADLLDEYKPLDVDVKQKTAPGQELRFNRISPRLAELFEKDIQERIAPIIRTHWWPITLGHVRMPFVLKYSPDTQDSMDPHHDAALVSMTMPLNMGYEGGYLSFPRQHWDTRDMEVGHLVLFPSRVTHVHWVSPVTSGTRYAMTCWIDQANFRPEDAILP